MGRYLDLNVVESEAELKTLIAEQTDSKIRDKIQLLYFIKTQSLPLKNLALIFHKDQTTLQRWVRKYRNGGIAELIGHRNGYTYAIPLFAIDLLSQELQKPEVFSSYADIQRWLERECKVTADYQTVYRIVRNHLKFKL